MDFLEMIKNFENLDFFLNFLFLILNTKDYYISCWKFVISWSKLILFEICIASDFTKYKQDKN